MQTEKNDKKKVSVIVPIYNAELHISQCLNSIINQTYTNLEILLINDGSTDSSLEIINNFSIKDKRIKIINKSNGGVASARNLGLKLSTGQYIMFLDNDDMINLDLVKTFIENIEENDIIICGYTRQTYDGKTIFKRKLCNDNLAPFIQLACWGKMYNAKYIKQFKFMESKIADDFYFNILAYDNTKKIKTINYCGYYWLFNPKSLSNTNNKQFKLTKELLNVLTSIYQNVQNIDFQLINYFYIRTIIYYILFSCKRVDKKVLYSNYEIMIKWLEDHNISLKNDYIGIFKNNSESFSVKLAIIIFIQFKKLNIIKPVLYFYSKI
jgi:glycosyltransferase involved in cell wall biosynthesis